MRPIGLSIDPDQVAGFAKIDHPPAGEDRVMGRRPEIPGTDRLSADHIGTHDLAA
ncbi:hypothetical protein D3C83_103430 [compost metagenome]